MINLTKQIILQCNTYTNHAETADKKKGTYLGLAMAEYIRSSSSNVFNISSLCGLGAALVQLFSIRTTTSNASHQKLDDFIFIALFFFCCLVSVDIKPVHGDRTENKKRRKLFL